MMKSTKMSLRALTFSAALCASLGTSLDHRSAEAETCRSLSCSYPLDGG